MHCRMCPAPHLFKKICNNAHEVDNATADAAAARMEMDNLWGEAVKEKDKC